MEQIKNTMSDRDFNGLLPTQFTTHNILCSEGRYAGQRYTRLPIQELRRLSRRSGVVGEISSNELRRRGMPRTSLDIDISQHAINRASQRFIRLFLNDSVETGDGLLDWLTKMSREALEEADADEDVISHRGMKFVFQRSGPYPLLKTVH